MTFQHLKLIYFKIQKFDYVKNEHDSSKTKKNSGILPERRHFQMLIIFLAEVLLMLLDYQLTGR